MATPEQSSESLISAMKWARIPAENHAFVKRIVDAVGIAEYRAAGTTDKPYVIARRRDGRADLHIAWGYTNGFGSEDEIVRIVGEGAERRPSSRKGTWLVEHPTTRVHQRNDRARDVRREADFCGCGMQRSVTGVCGMCD